MKNEESKHRAEEKDGGSEQEGKEVGNRRKKEKSPWLHAWHDPVGGIRAFSRQAVKQRSPEINFVFQLHASRRFKW